MDSRILCVEGRAVAVPGDDVDTDRIMPARYLRCVTFADIGQYTFQDERFDAAGNKKNHPFNDPRHAGAAVLVVNKNFGCGSSREHAPQGILRWGIRAIVGESFAEIFAGNCTAIGLPAVTAAESDVCALQKFAENNPEAPVTVDIEKKEVRFGNRRLPVGVRESAHRMFLDGTWDSSATLMAAREQARKTAERLPYLDWGRLA
jgi:3-isopropylmalate/(R)-2-methylmalate dehydratase small subunit